MMRLWHIIATVFFVLFGRANPSAEALAGEADQTAAVIRRITKDMARNA